jgi:hypothetical protein
MPTDIQSYRYLDRIECYPTKYQRVVYVREKVAIFNNFFSTVNIHQNADFFFEHLQVYKTLHPTLKKQINMQV